MSTASSFALACLGVEAIQPNEKEAFTGIGAPCAICGEDAHAHGMAWNRQKAITSSFGPVESFANQASEAVCGACAHFAVGRTFQAVVHAKDLEGKIKMWPQVSWRSYSHIFVEGHGHIIPSRDDWRAFLTAPPDRRFLAVMTSSGKKNILYRSTVAEDNAFFPVQVEDGVTWVHSETFSFVLSGFEDALAAGLRRDELLTGNYSASSIFKVGRQTWTAHEDAIRDHRTRRLSLLRLAHAVGKRPAD
jgi:hypothetical protein